MFQNTKYVVNLAGGRTIAKFSTEEEARLFWASYGDGYGFSQSVNNPSDLEGINLVTENDVFIENIK